LTKILLAEVCKLFLYIFSEEDKNKKKMSFFISWNPVIPGCNFGDQSKYTYIIHESIGDE